MSLTYRVRACHSTTPEKYFWAASWTLSWDHWSSNRMLLSTRNSFILYSWNFQIVRPGKLWNLPIKILYESCSPFPENNDFLLILDFILKDLIKNFLSFISNRYIGRVAFIPGPQYHQNVGGCVCTKMSKDFNQMVSGFIYFHK